LFSAGGMAQGGEWSRLSNQGQTFLRADSFSPGYTLFSVGGMAQGEEWSRLINQNNHSSLLEKNKPGQIFFQDLTDVSERLAQMIQFILTIFSMQDDIR
jgi:hypothetical protein